MDDFVIRRRKRKRKQIIRRIIFLSLVCAVIIAVAAFAMHAKSKKESDTALRTAAETIYPLKPETEANLDAAILKKDNVKTCYLTFDDGPTMSVTPRILDILRRYNVKATFFTVGTLIENNKNIARREYDEGHLLANHSYSHNYSDFYASKENFMSEIDKTYNLIYEITGEKDYPRVFRFPGGGFNAGSHGAAKQEYKTVLKENNIRYCDWNALNGDAEGKSRSAEELVERVKKTTKGKEDVVILMHDAATKSTTADALPYIIEYLMSQGYSFKTLAQAPLV